jgi:predicted nucleotidyltransferase
MGKEAKKPAKQAAQHLVALFRYQSPNIPMAAIRRYARQIAEKFDPEKIILFGSYAYGTPHEWSDVDILVVMPAYDEIRLSIRITLTVRAPFSLDLIVRTPDNLRRGLEEEDWFLREIIAKGKVVYEKADETLGAKSRGRLRRRKNPGAEQPLSQ